MDPSPDPPPSPGGFFGWFRSWRRLYAAVLVTTIAFYCSSSGSPGRSDPESSPPVQLLDWIVVAAYFGLIITVGALTGRGNRGLDDYFLARRSMPWYAMGLSVMATQASAITLVGTTGQAYVDGMRFIQIYLGLPSPW